MRMANYEPQTNGGGNGVFNIPLELSPVKDAAPSALGKALSSFSKGR